MKEIIIIAHLISLLLLLLLQLMTMSLLWLLGLSLRSTLHLAAAAMKHVAHCMPRTRCYCSLTGGSSVTRAAVPSPWAALPLPPLILFLCDESHARLHWLARSHDTLTRVTGRRVNAVSAARLTTRSILILIIIVRSPAAAAATACIRRACQRHQLTPICRCILSANFWIVANALIPYLPHELKITVPLSFFCYFWLLFTDFNSFSSLQSEVISAHLQ